MTTNKPAAIAPRASTEITVFAQGLRGQQFFSAQHFFAEQQGMGQVPDLQAGAAVEVAVAACALGAGT